MVLNIIFSSSAANLLKMKSHLILRADQLNHNPFCSFSKLRKYLLLGFTSVLQYGCQILNHAQGIKKKVTTLQVYLTLSQAPYPYHIVILFADRVTCYH